MLRWNPHFHSIVLAGGFDEQGTFVYIPLGHLETLTELLRRRVIALLVARKLLDRRFARNMLSWRFASSIHAFSDLWLNTFASCDLVEENPR